MAEIMTPQGLVVGLVAKPAPAKPEPKAVKAKPAVKPEKG